ncbi:hypothetical protein BCR39DRAFT_512070 [Naematelia encephala]|uniref:Zn(2)-C6 fungal-type domain-containing protein n=1 Tax=Naematelia encephala TaxID=71784 RepID=A0A1Y2BLX3_9TREE|nr:hypothetical protein BCR39DRAFT_512070 [Naematelia encephala]
MPGGPSSEAVYQQRLALILRQSQRSAQPLQNPPSRLSPPAVPSHLVNPAQNHSSNTDSKLRDDPMFGNDSRRRRDSTPKRGYRACVHCRLRKAKCDLGDPNFPSEPPCSRCRREQRMCVFLPSKRKRRNSGPEDASEEKLDVYPSHSGSQAGPSQAGPSQSRQSEAITDEWANLLMPDDRVPPTIPEQNAFPISESAQSLPPVPQPIPGNLSDGPTPLSLPSTTSSALSPSHSRPKRHREETTREIITSSFANETDALEILANAATDKTSEGHNEKHVLLGEEEIIEKPRPTDLRNFVLVKQRILNEAACWELCQEFFKDWHAALPIFPANLIPRSAHELPQLASTDPFLLTTLICVASRHHPDPRFANVHERIWSILRQTLSDYSLSGLPASVGFVEGVLLLAEFLPREKSGGGVSLELLKGPETSEGLQGTENRRSWSLTGMALRAAYGLGLDQLALELPEEHDRNLELERARSAWTWCYLYDRTIGLRTGLAFWSRGPTLCYQGYSHISQTGEAAARQNFPLMLSPADTTSADAGKGDDCASLMQALIELTQIMTNSHDILYPSKGRTSALVRQGTYFKFCDHFRKALESYDLAWSTKQWRYPTLKELAACTYHFVRLYVSSFAFQAHVQRAQMRAEEEARAQAMGLGAEPSSKTGVSLFPRGSATSPDALYIYESIDAANEILNICLRLGRMGALRYLPSRYLINFVYGGVFALKVGYSGAVSKADAVKTRELVDLVCAALVLACPDRDHPASRYGGMLRMLSKKLEQLSDQSAVPSRFPSPEPQSTADLPMFTNPDPLGFALSDTPGMDLSQPTGEGLFDFDVEGVNFNLDGFWEDFSLLGEGSGFPFK